jgi:hypothetical protein
MTRQITPKTKLQQERQKEHSSVFSVFSIVAKVIKKEKKGIAILQQQKCKTKTQNTNPRGSLPRYSICCAWFFLPPLFCHSLTHIY